MTFADPVWLYLTPLVALLVTAMLGHGMRRRDTLLARFAAHRLLQQLTEQADLKRSLIKSASLCGPAAITGPGTPAVRRGMVRAQGQGPGYCIRAG